MPFFWKEFCGGIEFAWVRFTISIKERALGSSMQGATWLVDWLKKTARAIWVKIADLQAVMGRLSFALTARRPYGFSWDRVAQAQRVGQLPKADVYIATYGLPASKRELFRSDARADGNEVWIGGWALDHQVRYQDKKRCRWFAEGLDQQSAPWLHAVGEAYGQIGALDGAAGYASGCFTVRGPAGAASTPTLRQEETPAQVQFALQGGECRETRPGQCVRFLKGDVCASLVL